MFQTNIQPQTQVYRENLAQMRAVVDAFRQELKKSLYQGEEKHISKSRAAGKLLARERIEILLDPDSPFLELLPLAGYGNKPLFALGGTMVAGIGVVSGVIALIYANVYTVKGGAIDKVTLQKSLRLNQIALENNLSTISLVESAGANLPEQAHIFNYGGEVFRDITRRSKKNLPTISVVFGNSTAGGAYIPGMADYTIFVKKAAKVFLAGPPLVKMATGEVSDEESLGGAEMHGTVSGVADYIAENELDALRIARELMADLRANLTKGYHTAPSSDEPLYDPEEILGVLQADIKKPFDVRELIIRFTDGSRFSEFKPDYGSTIVTGFAEVCGYPIGIIGNNGVIFSESANKATQFIQLCNRNQTPLLFLQNTTGFMVGKTYEEGGIIKNGAKMINAVSNSEVPAITIMIGASYGAGNYAMCGRAYQPRFLFAYPHSRIAVMGPEQLAGVMDLIQREAAQKAGVPYDEPQAELVKMMAMQQVDKESTALYATGQLWDDGVIDPRDTRAVLGVTLAVVYNAGFESRNEYGVFRM